MKAWMNKLLQSSFVAMLGMVPSWLLFGLMALTLLMAGGWINEQRWQAKYQRHLNEDQQAIQKAKTAQATDNQSAAIAYITADNQQKSTVIERHNEAKSYETHSKPTVNTSPRECTADDFVGDEFVRLHNHTPSRVPTPAN